jgi:hypothetical protein
MLYRWRLKGYLVNCLEHFFLLFFCFQIMFPQLFAWFQILFLLNNQYRRQGVSYLTTLVNLVHGERYNTA